MNLNKLFYLFFTILITINATTEISSKNLKKMDNDLIRPEYLKAGDTIAIVAPSGVLNDQENYIIMGIFQELIKKELKIFKKHWTIKL